MTATTAHCRLAVCRPRGGSISAARVGSATLTNRIGGLQVFRAYSTASKARPVNADTATVPSTSNVGKGRLYEHSCKSFLESTLAMQLTVCGGAGDQGVDLRGRWQLDVLHDILVQCKHYKQKLGPAAIREMEGTASYYTSPQGIPPLSLVCAKSGFSMASWKRAIASSQALLLLHLDSDPAAPMLNDNLLPLECRGAWCNPAFRQIAGAYFSTQTVHISLPGEGFKTIIDLRRKIDA
ncbi:hypothetical protein P389DRAFT_111384 [Cystobasidium minutum MCA 4210]|uniref:uncharacterized protein n=1 Tax=Cystobasidium minutum MCA 4210 TaxID=1397322 RepID=UPI0034CEBBF9|eukprot:jgi/Rhomi1/111384/CE111383_1583